MVGQAWSLRFSLYWFQTKRLAIFSSTSFTTSVEKDPSPPLPPFDSAHYPPHLSDLATPPVGRRSVWVATRPRLRVGRLTDCIDHDQERWTGAVTIPNDTSTALPWQHWLLIERRKLNLVASWQLLPVRFEHAADNEVDDSFDLFDTSLLFLPTLKAIAEVRFSPLCVCFARHLKNRRIGPPNLTEILHNEFWKPAYFGLKRSKVTSHKNLAGVGLCSPVSAGFFSLLAVCVNLHTYYRPVMTPWRLWAVEILTQAPVLFSSWQASMATWKPPRPVLHWSCLATTDNWCACWNFTAYFQRKTVTTDCCRPNKVKTETSFPGPYPAKDISHTRGPKWFYTA